MKIVIALGGNMISDASKKGENFDDQIKNVENSAEVLVDIIEDGHQIIITHGNGPQVGSFLLQQQPVISGVTKLPLKILNAVTQGQIGIMLQHAILNELNKRSIQKNAFIIPTTVIVDKNDSGFVNPTKPVGPFYSEEDYAHKKNDGNVYHKLDKGWRRLVPSPKPIEIYECELINNLSEKNNLVISVGGGGSPTVRNDDGSLKLVDAVIDKDLASSVLASKIGADMLLILTNVEGIYENYGTENQQVISQLSPTEAERLIESTDLGAGSMEPKVKACLEFVKNGGMFAGITVPKLAVSCINREAGSVISN